jgi:hypothetical protein
MCSTALVKRGAASHSPDMAEGRNYRLSLLLLLFEACVGGQTGGSSVPPQCELEPPREVALSDAPAGFSMQEVLVFAAGEHAFEAAWPSASATPAQGALAITVQGDRARFSDVRFRPPVGGESCLPQLETDVRVELTLNNEHGTTRAVFDSVLTARSRSIARVFNPILEPKLFEGDVQFPLASGEQLASLQLEVNVSAVAIAGTLWANALHSQQTEVDEHAYDVERFEAAAVWPAAEACGPGNHPVGLHDTLFDVQPGEVALELPQTLELTWQDGATTSATFMLAPAAETACFTEGCEQWCPAQMANLSSSDPAGRALLRLPVTLEVDTRDGRWSGRLDAELWIEVRQSGGLSRVFVRAESEHASAAALATATGLEGVGNDGKATFALLVTFTPEGSTWQARGGITIKGPPRGHCEQGDHLCPGAAVPSVLLEAGISTAR